MERRTWGCRSAALGVPVAALLANELNVLSGRDSGVQSLRRWATCNLHMRSGADVGGYKLQDCMRESCILAKQVWSVLPPQSLLPDHPESLVMVLECYGYARFSEGVCRKMRWLKRLNPKHIIDCVASGVAHVERGGGVTPYFVQERAKGSSLASLVRASVATNEKMRKRILSRGLEGYVEDPPRRLRTLAGVFDIILEIFGIMDAGIAPRVDRQIRYYFGDLHWGNVMMAEDGHLSIIDQELTIICHTHGDGGQVLQGPRPTRMVLEVKQHAHVCTPELDRQGKFLSLHHLFLTLLMLLLRYRSPSKVTLDIMETEMAVVSLPQAARRFFGPQVRCGCSGLAVPGPLDTAPLLAGRMWFPGWGQWPDGHAPGAGGGLQPTLADAELAAEVLVFHLHTAFQRDWSRLPLNRSQLLVSGLRALQACDASWPPAFIVHLRGLRALL